MNDAKKMNDRDMRVTINQAVAMVRDQLDEAVSEQTTALHKSIHEKDLLSNWSNASFIGTLLSGLSSIVSGSFLISSGNQSGYQFISAGVLMLIQTVMSYEDRWATVAEAVSFGNEKAKETLQNALPLAIMLFAYLLAGKTIKDLPYDHEQKMKVIDSFINFFSLVTKTGEYWTKYKMGMADLELKTADSKVEILELRLKQYITQQPAISDTHTKIGANYRRIQKKIINAGADAARGLT
jgi:hypothetical protein